MSENNFIATQRSCPLQDLLTDFGMIILGKSHLHLNLSEHRKNVVALIVFRIVQHRATSCNVFRVGSTIQLHARTIAMS